MTLYIMYACMSRIKHRLRKLVKVSYKEIWLWGFICSQRFKLKRYSTIWSTIFTLGWYSQLSVNSNLKTSKLMKIWLCERPNWSLNTYYTLTIDHQKGWLLLDNIYFEFGGSIFQQKSVFPLVVTHLKQNWYKHFLEKKR